MTDQPQVPDYVRELLSRPTVDLCPNCKTILGPRSCHMTYSTWRCFGCGATLDGRVISPDLAFKCENTFPDYTPRLGEPVHPLACSCSGRGWYPLKETIDGHSRNGSNETAEEAP